MNAATTVHTNEEAARAGVLLLEIPLDKISESRKTRALSLTKRNSQNSRMTSNSMASLSQFSCDLSQTGRLALTSSSLAHGAIVRRSSPSARLFPRQSAT